MRMVVYRLILLTVLVFVASMAAAHNWHQEFTQWSGSGGSSTSNFSSSTGGATGSYSVLYSDPAPTSSELYRDSTNNWCVFNVGSTSKRFRFGSFLASSVRPSTGGSVGWRMEKTGTNVTRGPFQFLLHAGGDDYNSWTTYIVVTGSQIIPKANNGSQQANVDALSLSLSGMNTYCLAGRSHTDNFCYWKLWVNGTLRQFTGSNGGSGKTNPWGESYSFRTAKDGDYWEKVSMIGLGDLHKSTYWGWRFAWVRWTDQGDVYFGDPYFHSNPANQTKNVGETATFSVSAWSEGTVEYQWQVRPSGGSWSNISGATSSSYTTPTLTAGDDGKQYRCRSRRGTWPYVYSQPATLTISCIAPSITSHPTSRTVCEGESVTFSVTATGTQPLSYQWMKDSQDEIPSATSSSYTINNVSWGDVGSYHCVVTNVCGTVHSNGAMLMVNIAPTITLQPQSAYIIEGGSVTFSVEADGTAPLSYQWRKNEIDIPGAQSSTCIIDPAAISDSGDFDCVITNVCGFVTSDTAVLIVGPPIYPLGMSTRQVGGGDWYYDSQSGAGQQGVLDGVGLNNIGLLVRTWGSVTHVGTDFFYLDDGSGVNNGSGIPGVKVRIPLGVDLPSEGNFAAITGVSCSYRLGESLYPQIRVRKDRDISVVE